MDLVNDYKSEIRQKLLDDAVSGEAAVKATAEWYTRRGRELFVSGFEHETKLKLGKTLTDGHLVEMGFPDNIADYSSKAAWGNFYRANGMIFLREADEILTPTAANRLEAGHSPVVFWDNLRAILKPLFLDSVVLLEHWAVGAMQVPGVFGIGKNVWEEPVHLYHSALQCIYGNYSSFARRDNQSDTAITHLRVAIELRIRRGFGILGRLDMNRAVGSLMLSRILDALTPFQNQITFIVPLPHIIRIYSWSNLYMHAGLKLYTWSPLFALRYLAPFLVGGKAPNGDRSVFAGISASEQTIKDVQKAVEADVASDGSSLILMDAKDCDLVAP